MAGNARFLVLNVIISLNPKFQPNRSTIELALGASKCHVFNYVFEVLTRKGVIFMVRKRSSAMKRMTYFVTTVSVKSLKSPP